MKKTGIVLATLLMMVAMLLNVSIAAAATDGYYQLSEVTQPVWDATDASRTKAPTVDYDYTYGDESSVTYTLPWSFSFYGQSYSQITADTNGNIWFGATDSAHSFNLSNTSRGPVIAAWNNDLSSYFYGGVFVQHKTNPERVVIEWQTETYSDEGAERINKFAIVIFSNGAMRTDYGAFSHSVGKDFGSGISRGDGTVSLNVTSTYGNVFTLAGRSFLFASGRKIYVGSQTENFGDIPSGTASPAHTISVVNGGAENLLINAVNLSANSSGMYSLVAGGDGCSGAVLAPSQTCTVQAVFFPTAIGPQSAVLSITSDDAATPVLDITLNGTGNYPTLTVAKSDTGSGAVSSSPAGISCGAVCSGPFATGSTVTLSASPDAGSAFTGWSGACSGTGDCTVTMDAAKNVAASFTSTSLPTVTIISPAGNIANKRPVLQYTVSSGTTVVKVDGVVVSKASGDALEALSEGSHLIRVEATNKAGFTGFAESTVTIDTQAPTFSVTPAAGTQNVPVTAVMLFSFNEPINTASITKDTIVVSSSFGPVPGTFSVSPDASTVTFKPLAQLGYNRDYTVSFNSRIEDLIGNAATVNSSSTFKTQLASTDLVGLWHMDGDWSDASGNGRHGTASGEATFSTDRADGTMAGSFNGTSDYLSIGNLFGNFPGNVLTIESWVKLNDAGSGGRRTIAGGTGAYADYAIGLSNNQFVTFINSGVQNSSGYYAYSDETPNIGQWYHIVGTFDGSRLKLYVNGQLKSDIAATWGQSNGGANFWVGSESCCGSNNFNGLIDKVAVYKRALTAQEILGLYNDAPKVTLTSPGQTVKYKSGETGTATVTVTHPVGVTSLTCTAGGAASGNLSESFDLPQTQVMQDFTFQMAPNATASTSATILCTSADASQNTGNASINLTVADITVPMVLGTSIADNAVDISAIKPIIVTFSEALSQATVNTSSVTLTIDDGTDLNVEGSIALSADLKSITFIPTVALAGNTAYKLTISATVADTAGNPLVQDFVLHFVTAPVVALSVIGKGTSSEPYVLVSDRYSTISIDNSYVVCNGPVIADSISLNNGSILSHSGATTTATYKLEITAGSINIDATSKFDVSGKGYLGGKQGGNTAENGMTIGNTTGGSANATGGSYGGLGGLSAWASSAGASYGSMQLPVDLGAGGSGNTGGNGGGAIKVAADSLVLNGSVMADGEAAINSNFSGGGSGGSIQIRVGTLSGAGAISARGGRTTNTNNSGGGGGGRISIYYDSNSLPISNIVAGGGQSGDGTISSHNGGAGTIFLKDNARQQPDVIINNGGTATSNATPVPGGDYGMLDVTSGAVIAITGNYTTDRDVVLVNTQMTIDGAMNLPGNLTLTNSTLNVSGDLTVPGNIQMTNSTLSTGNGPVNVTGGLILNNGSILSHYGATTTAVYKLEVTAGSVSVDASSRIDVTGKGYLGGASTSQKGTTLGNTTTGGSDLYCGGSYGGIGGMNYSFQPNASYGSIAQPVDLGSGGAASNSGGSYGTNGGGAVKLTAGSLVLNGSIWAKGVDNGNANAYGGAGSGGSIWLNVGNLSGTGTISANGGSFTPNTTGGSGGGGRVAIYYDANSLPSANVTAYGGKSSTGSVANRNGGAGTIYFKDNARITGDVLVDNGNIATNGVTTVAGGSYGQVTASNGAKIAISGDISFDRDVTLTGSTLTYGGGISTTGNLTLDASDVTVKGAVNVSGLLTLRNGSVLTHANATTTATYKLEVTAGSVSVDASSRIDVTGKGYLGGASTSQKGTTLGNTTTGGSDLYCGGSYGGIGGMNYSYQPNASYGSIAQPVDLGSGGAASNYGGSYGTNGGGAVKLTAGSLVLNGSIWAKGVDNGNANAYGGAGSGGSIWLNVGNLSGTGTISANGGSFTPNTTGGSGGGGRVAIYYDTNSLPAANVTAFGGKSSTGSVANRNGGAGTIYFKDNARITGDVLVDNGNIATNSVTTVTGGSYGQVTASNGAKIAISGDISFDRDVTLTGSTLTYGGGISTTGNLTLDASNVTVKGAVNVSGLLTLRNGSVLTHANATTTATYKLEITAGSVSVDASSRIDVTGKGYLGGASTSQKGTTLGNTTTGGSDMYCGGSYGGMGGMNYSYQPNASYGNIAQPVDLGSGGAASNYGASYGSSGGGAVKLTAGSLVLHGGIWAMGSNNGCSNYGGAGSGGSIWLNVGNLSGTGTISANGGSFTPNTTGGSGGGGRVAIYYDTNSLPSANVTAYGGKSSTGSVANRNGGAGTIYLKDNARAAGDVLVDNGNIVTNSASTVAGGSYGQVTATNGTKITVSGDISTTDMTLDGSTVTMKGLVNVSGVLTLRNGTVLTHANTTTTTTYKLEVTAGSVSVDATSRVDVSGKGYLGGASTGQKGTTLGNTTTGGSDLYCGGSYGGLGGRYSNYQPNATYGNMAQPVELGSGGAASNYGASYGSSGGGAVKLTAGSLVLHGGIWAMGSNNGCSNYGGAGSGGSIWLNAGNLSGTGTISASGGSFTPNTTGGSGGGGRIAVYYDTSTLPVGNITVAGGRSGDGSNSARNGGNGSLYLYQYLNPLTVTKTGSSTGTVQSSPSGIACGSTCNANFARNGIVTLSAAPDAGASFSGWSGACTGTGSCSVTMDAAKTVTATFNVTLPSVVISSPAGLTSNNQPLLEYSITGTTTSMVVKVDNVVVSKVSGHHLDALPDGLHTVRVEATNVGGTGTAESGFTVDTVPAVTEATPAGGIYSSAQSVTLSCSDATSGCDATYYCLGEGCTPATQYSGAIPIASSQHLRFYSKDKVGTQETVKDSFYTIGMSVSPANINSSYQGNVSLAVSNPGPLGGEAFVEQFVDANRNGVIDTGDYVVRSFRLTDGAASANPNVQGDEDGAANGKLMTTINYSNLNDVYHAPGQYLFRFTGQTGSDMVPFTVSQVTATQQVSGTVRSGANPIAGAMVRVTDKWLRTISFTIADESGHYSIQVKDPGNYLVIPAAYGYASPTANLIPFTVAANESVTNNLNLATGTYHVTGRVKDLSDGVAIPGVWVEATGQAFSGVALTGDDGSYDLFMPAGDYTIGVTSGCYGPAPFMKGYVAEDGSIAQTIALSADQGGQDIMLGKGSVLASGRVVDLLGQGVSGVPVEGRVHGDSLEPLAIAVSDGNGDYVLNLSEADNWSLAPLSAVAQTRGYLGTVVGGVSTNSGPVSGNDLILHPISAWVEGHVRYPGGNPVPGVKVELRKGNGLGETTPVASVRTAGDGEYRIGAYTGADWLVRAYTQKVPQDPDQSIPLVDEQVQSINFTESYDLQPITQLLPDGINGLSYTGTVGVTGGMAPYSYYVETGVLPDGLSLDSASGTIEGIPITTGTSSFIIKAMDANGVEFQKSYQISIN